MRTARSASPVIELDRVRDARRIVNGQGRAQQALQSSRRALSRLFNSGLVYSRAGARLARDLLLVHQQLLRASELLSRLAETPQGARTDAEGVLTDFDELLARTDALTARSEGVLARR